MQRKITLHHPVIVLRLRFQHVCYRSSLILPEIEHFYPIFQYKTAGKVDKRLLADMFEDRIDIIAQLGISDYLRNSTSQVADASASAPWAPSSSLLQ